MAGHVYYITDRVMPVYANSRWTTVAAGAIVEAKSGRGAWYTLKRPFAAQVRIAVLERCAHLAAPVELVGHQATSR